MGAFYPGVPAELALFLRDAFHCEMFVESGTYLGDTALWASRHFQYVVTMELSETLYARVSQQYAHITNINFLRGSSADLLKPIARISSNVLFWLDAHWSAGITAGADLPCPLLQEIRTILSHNQRHVMLIDDARFLTMQAPNAPRHAMPYISEVLDELNRHGKRYNAIWRDVMLSVPMDGAEAAYNFLAEQTDMTDLASSFLSAQEILSSN